MSLNQKISLPLDEFINLSLYDKKSGFYMKKMPLETKVTLLLHQISQDYFLKWLQSGL